MTKSFRQVSNTYCAMRNIGLQNKITMLTLFGFLFVSISVQAQDSTYVDILDMIDEEKVHWVGQIPPLDDGSKKKKKGWFKRLVLGEKDVPGLQKPVLALPVNEKEVLILDQGNSTLFFAEDDELD